MSEGRRLELRSHDGLVLVADAFGDPQAPPVLLQHGGGQTRHAWGGTARALAARGHHAVALDLRGHGESAWCPRGDYGFESFARDTLAVAEQLGQPPALVGASLGGIAGLLAIDLGGPDRFTHLVLVDVTPRMNAEGAAAIVAFMAERLEEGFATLEEAADAIAAYLPHRPRPQDLSGLQKNLRLGPDGRYRWHWDPRFVRGGRPPGERIAQVDLDAAAEGLTLPTLLVRGRMSEMVDEAHARDFLARVPHASYVDVSGAGHMVAGDRNDAFTEAVLEFLGARTHP